MIALLRGTIVEKGPGWVLVDTGGVGYEVNVPTGLAERAGAPGTPIQLRTYLDVREEALDLYGFLDRDELEVFKALISVTRVGPRLAVKVLSALSPRAIVQAVLAQDAETFEGVPGLGEETARRVLLDLSKKVKKLQLSPDTSRAVVRGASPVRQQAESALRNLGYKGAEVDRRIDWALAQAKGEPTLEELLKKALAYDKDR